MSTLLQMEAQQLHHSINAVAAVRAVIAVDAFKRKPEEYKSQTFFGEYDIWHYIPIFDAKLCPKCLDHATTKYFMGPDLRGNFKYLRIIDANTIAVMVHPHCRCILTRVTDPLEYLWVTRELFG